MNPVIIDKIRNYFVGKPVIKAWIFGSVSRAEETPESDVGILVWFDSEA